MAEVEDDLDDAPIGVHWEDDTEIRRLEEDIRRIEEETEEILRECSAFEHEDDNDDDESEDESGVGRDSFWKGNSEVSLLHDEEEERCQVCTRE
jgi:hypothetical protein